MDLKNKNIFENESSDKISKRLRIIAKEKRDLKAENSKLKKELDKVKKEISSVHKRSESFKLKLKEFKELTEANKVLKKQISDNRYFKENYYRVVKLAFGDSGVSKLKFYLESF